MVKKPSALPRSFFSVRRLLRRSVSGRHYRRTTSATARTPAAPPQGKLHGRTVVVDVEGWLLKSPLSTFPYFMLVAIEAGSFLRGLLLLLMYPILRCLCLLGGDLYLKAMVMVSFSGLREKEVTRISKAVLPKFFLEEVTMEGLEAFNEKPGKVVAVTSAFPRVIVKGFLEEYLGVHAIVGREIVVVAGRYVGFLKEERSMERVGAILEEMDEMKGNGDGAVGLVAIGSRMHHVFSQYCKVSIYVFIAPPYKLF
jgi:glycerol-3-phosphate acyltransferase